MKTCYLSTNRETTSFHVENMLPTPPVVETITTNEYKRAKRAKRGGAEPSSEVRVDVQDRT